VSTLQEIGEKAAVERLRPFLDPHPLLKTGAGDDCAVTAASETFDFVFTTDPLTEGVHFHSGTPPAKIGHKAAARVLSDMAAMGAEPLFLLFNLSAPKTLEMKAAELLYAAAAALCRRFGAAIIGGDLAQGPVLELHGFGVGRVPCGTALLRSGAQPGDQLYVTGPLGGSLSSGRHLDFLPRIEVGRTLRESGKVSAMMDLSDGLAADLPRLCEASGAGAVLHAGRIPLNPGCTLENALHDGEDFELLFTATKLDPMAIDFPVYEIGTVTGKAGCLELITPDGQRSSLKKGGFEHFRHRNR